MWSKISQELAVPWRAAEAMHWHMGEQEIARRTSAAPWSSSNEPFNSSLSGQSSASLNDSRPFREMGDNERHKENINLPSLRSIFPNLLGPRSS